MPGLIIPLYFPRLSTIPTSPSLIILRPFPTTKTIAIIAKTNATPPISSIFPPYVYIFSTTALTPSTSTTLTFVFSGIIVLSFVLADQISPPIEI